ncbi:8-oxo-dGTP pyrophosphatase MutT (NUDIX family) [Shimia isoporae]|uniref:8-oxo-dGTP pyrophosphatase MutT (NUDIX family) n=1 Tax=Shimia isoporae TaxID=647720 RepID=A0A4R1NXS4_9RHOB|nr:NUDIX hydrolase [Shimia isoporae]TCL09992.1 8-oxo-dGTP pyrophosphatase MutT (NUDIX family) [Shimia isoporae]
MGRQDPKTVASMLRKAGKSGSRIQFAALPYRLRKGKPEILLITSRGTRQWLLPKGWPMEDIKPHKAAAQEAWEEAGVRGKPSKHCVGIYTYRKSRGAHRGKKFTVLVFPLKVAEKTKSFPERGQRDRKWLSPRKAAKRILMPDLAKIVRGFDPKLKS